MDFLKNLEDLSIENVSKLALHSVINNAESSKKEADNKHWLVGNDRRNRSFDFETWDQVFGE